MFKNLAVKCQIIGQPLLDNFFIVLINEDFIIESISYYMNKQISKFKRFEFDSGI
jgi:hypothetical protein